MSNERTNFLPPSRLRVLKHEYFFRLGVVGLVLITLLTMLAAILLVPTYIFVEASIKAKEASLANSAAYAPEKDEVVLEARLKTLSRNIVTLTALGTTQSASNVTRQIFAIPRVGIRITGSNYTSGKAEETGTVILSGVASTRDALRTYQLALQSAAFIRAANLPVSAYAKDADIPFVITVTLSP